MIVGSLTVTCYTGYSVLECCSVIVFGIAVYICYVPQRDIHIILVNYHTLVIRLQSLHILCPLFISINQKCIVVLSMSTKYSGAN
jgi:hypothetical protein